MRVLLLGCNGLLGSYFVESSNKRDKVFSPGKNELNIKNTQKFYEFIKENSIEMCVNVSGVTNIYLCETNIEEALKVNAYAPAECAKICLDNSVRFIHISTGFVFDGKKNTPYVESDTAAPINAYGESKYRGELFILRENPEALIIRSDEIYGRGSSTLGHNIIAYIINHILNKKTLMLYSIKTSPTYAYDLAKFIWLMKERRDVTGILHATNKGSYTYFEIAEMIGKLLKSKVTIKKRSDILKYKIPENCSLESERFNELQIKEFRPFDDAMKDCLKEFL